MKTEQILELVEAVSNSALSEFKYEEGGVKLSLKKTTEPCRTTSISVTRGEAAQDTEAATELAGGEKTGGAAEGNIVKSPLIGTFYTAPSEDAKPFVSVGDSVEEGQILAIVEAMKLMNEIESDFAGTIAEILVENGDTVEYGQPLFVIQ